MKKTENINKILVSLFVVASTVLNFTHAGLASSLALITSLTLFGFLIWTERRDLKDSEKLSKEISDIKERLSQISLSRLGR